VSWITQNHSLSALFFQLVYREREVKELASVFGVRVVLERCLFDMGLQRLVA